MGVGPAAIGTCRRVVAKPVVDSVNVTAPPGDYDVFIDPNSPVKAFELPNGWYLVNDNTPERRKVSTDFLQGCMKAAYWDAIEKGMRFGFSLRSADHVPRAWIHGGDIRAIKEYKARSRYMLYERSTFSEAGSTVKVFFNKPWRAFEAHKGYSHGTMPLSLSGRAFASVDKATVSAIIKNWWDSLPTYDPDGEYLFDDVVVVGLT